MARSDDRYVHSGRYEEQTYRLGSVIYYLDTMCSQCNHDLGTHGRSNCLRGNGTQFIPDVEHTNRAITAERRITTNIPTGYIPYLGIWRNDDDDGEQRRTDGSGAGTDPG